jgi:ribokinase
LDLSTPLSPHIVVVGSTMIDLMVYTDRAPERGQTIVGERLTIGHGGKGANQALMAAQLGADVTFVTRVGTDFLGDMALTNLTDRGLDVSRAKRVTGESGVASIWIEPDGHNRILIVPGANQALTAADVATDLADVPSADCVICQLEVSSEAVKEAFRWGRAHDATTILNPAPAFSLDREMLELVDWLVPNENEFADIFDTNADDDANLLRVGPQLRGGLVVTLGPRGAAAVIDGRVIRLEPPASEPIDTTGAGDAFMGGFAFALSQREPLLAAMAIANSCGALSTTKRGTQASFPAREEVLKAAAESRA